MEIPRNNSDKSFVAQSKIKVSVIGGSVPLQKSIPVALASLSINLLHVFLDMEKDYEVMKMCNAAGIPVYSVFDLKTKEGIDIIRNARPDWILNINSVLILPEEILASATEGALNLHPGKLPEYAGLHTHQWAIRNGEKEFGVTIHWMEPGIDTGDIAFQTLFPIKDTDTGLSLFMKCTNESVKLLQEVFEFISNRKTIPRIKQDHSKRKLFTNKMAKNGEINWEANTNDILNFIRAADYDPFQCPTYIPFTFIEGKKYFIIKAKADDTPSNGAGKISCINDTGIVIGTGNTSIVVTKMKDENNKLIPKDSFSSLFSTAININT